MKKLKLEELNRATVAEFKAMDKFPVAVVLDNVRSMSNIGSIFRTCDAFAVEQLCLCGITACPPHREIEKTALGATQSVNWKYFENTLQAVDALKQEGYTIVAIEQAQNSTMLNNFTPLKGAKYALIFGNEVNGVDDEVMKTVDVCIEIPQFGTKHSFNVTVSAGIVLWEFCRSVGDRP
ncbi:RNA methyltransferase [Mucilaginibacter sp. L3T2-6]|uniref:RNA methyltransferase n=1 Tax=Mucilaginibacter sp. L3T2-6 TaxID=3062491 RepID=UPI0026768E8F|nr:RNA methyltransferase [Mucilaginibacter sp. L3T2-6]MDO3641729.1 RNA methyltransferase [Mucilaginibacter sp. L3T2-6]MDV6214223.1 RNA methyltransferase [Mucilaginibacter sp. L3T2-6]